MSGHLSPETLGLVEEVLNEVRGMRPSEVYRALRGERALITVRHALRELCQQGRVKHQGPDMARHYFRAALAQAQEPGEDSLCQCPKCGRMHRGLGAGRPPAIISGEPT